MTKVIIQIPCYNEAETLPETLADLPRSLPGIDAVEWLVIDDGSQDNTVEVARSQGVDHVVRHTKNLGLAKAFMTGLDSCVALGADVVVNTDADNQYCAEDIPKLIQPVLEGKADLVIGSRPIDHIEHFSSAKKFFQKVGSYFVRIVSQTDVNDAPSGFRAISREAAMRLHVFNDYTYTIETIIQAGQKGMAVTSIPIRTNTFKRKSRLIKNVWSYILKSGLTIIRIYMTYKPFTFFTIPGVISFLLGFALGLRFLYFYAIGNGAGHIQSLILASLLLGFGSTLVIVGLVVDLISVNRKLLEDLDYQMNRLEEKLNRSKNG